MLEHAGVRLVEPLPYVRFMSLVTGAAAAITDSGGIQEETTALGVPCFTVRDNTERPVTIAEGTNRLVRDLSTLAPLVRGATPPAEAHRPEGWDGEAGHRVVAALQAFVPPAEGAPEADAALARG